MYKLQLELWTLVNVELGLVYYGPVVVEYVHY